MLSNTKSHEKCYTIVSLTIFGAWLILFEDLLYKKSMASKEALQRATSGGKAECAMVQRGRLSPDFLIKVRPAQSPGAQRQASPPNLGQH